MTHLFANGTNRPSNLQPTSTEAEVNDQLENWWEKLNFTGANNLTAQDKQKLSDYFRTLYGVDGVEETPDIPADTDLTTSEVHAMTSDIADMIESLPPELAVELLNNLPDWLKQIVLDKLPPSVKEELEETAETLGTGQGQPEITAPQQHGQGQGNGDGGCGGKGKGGKGKPEAPDGTQGTQGTQGIEDPARTNGQEQAVLEGINKERAKAGLPPLKLATSGEFADSTDAAAEYYSTASEADRKNHTHFGTNGGGSRAENLAVGQQTGDDAVSAWTNSPGHYANMTGDHTEVAISQVIGPDGSPTWVTRFR